MAGKHIATVAALVALASCDPGFGLVPIDWQCGEFGLWALDSAGLRIEQHSPGGLIGSSYLSVELHVLGNEEPMVLDSALLKTQSGVLRAERASEPVGLPTGGGSLRALWFFRDDEPAFEALKDTTAATFYLSGPSGPTSIGVEYQWRDGVGEDCVAPAP